MNNTVIQSIVRATDILSCFEDSDELGVTEISNRTGLHRSTTFNIISTLERCRYLEKDESTSKYRLGIELFKMGNRVNNGLRKTVYPYLEKLVSLYKETVNFVMREGKHVVYMEKIESPHSMRIGTVVGGHMPIYATAVGKAMISGLSAHEKIDIISGLDFARFTDNTICDKEEFQKSIDDVRRIGYAEDAEELEIGLTCVAAPIFNHMGKPSFAISVSGPTSRMDKQRRREIGLSLVDMTKEISCKLGYKPSGGSK